MSRREARAQGRNHVRAAKLMGHDDVCVPLDDYRGARGGDFMSRLLQPI